MYIYSHIPDIISITLCLRKWINQYFCDRLRRNASQNVSSNSLWCQRDRQNFIKVYSQHEVIVPYRCTWSFNISVSSVLSFVDYVLHTLWKSYKWNWTKAATFICERNIYMVKEIYYYAFARQYVSVHWVKKLNS